MLFDVLDSASVLSNIDFSQQLGRSRNHCPKKLEVEMKSFERREMYPTPSRHDAKTMSGSQATIPFVNLEFQAQITGLSKYNVESVRLVGHAEDAVRERDTKSRINMMVIAATRHLSTGRWHRRWLLNMVNVVM
jgi:hypothetical protein